MVHAGITSVDAYIAAQPETIRSLLERVRSTIRSSVPAAEETISYKMPAYKLDGEVVLYFAGWKQHYSLYPATGRVLAEFKQELQPFKIHKATIRFPISQDVPEELIARIAKFRAQEIAEPTKSKPAANTSRSAKKKS